MRSGDDDPRHRRVVRLFSTVSDAGWPARNRQDLLSPCDVVPANTGVLQMPSETKTRTGGVLAATCLVDARGECEHLCRQHPASCHQRGHWDVAGHPAVGGDGLFAGRGCGDCDLRLAGRCVRPEAGLSARPAAVRRLLCPHRACQLRRNGDRRAHDPGCGGGDDLGLWAQSAFGGQYRPGAVEGGVAVGCRRSRWRRGGTFARWRLGGHHRMARLVLD